VLTTIFKNTYGVLDYIGSCSVHNVLSTASLQFVLSRQHTNERRETYSWCRLVW